MKKKSTLKTWLLIFFVCFVFVLSITTGHYIKSWKTEQETFAEVKPVVQENGDVTYTLNHIDPRGNKRVIHPWTITLPRDAYVWRKEAVEGSLPSDINVNGLRLNTQNKPNESMQFWLKMPELTFLTVDEYMQYIENDMSLFRDGVLQGRLTRIIVSAALNKLETNEYKLRIFLEDKSRNNENNIFIKTPDFKIIDFFNKGNLKNYNFYYEEIQDKIWCSIRSCRLSYTTENNVRVGVMVSTDFFAEFPKIIKFINDNIATSVEISDEAKRSAW